MKQRRWISPLRLRVRRGFSLIDVAIATLVMGAGILVFGAFYPTAARCAQMTGSYSQAISEVQHKIDQIRAVGYGRLTYTDLKAAGIIDTSPTASPYRFEAKDTLSNVLWDPIGTISVADTATDLRQVTVTLTWRRTAQSTQRSTHAITILVTNE
jgi:Tfp pilus assembly protein PilV